ncbi:synaptobrevin [Colletotrichum plurivorum]|uniref:Synaptobrevin n=1 Tax=Colletotrichum plurivorum TaxID=2175906 RepID=A0A8H6KAZ0_9PEZI|nr:synaptobrevin [Colletotrichum plurivorum]
MARLSAGPFQAPSATPERGAAELTQLLRRLDQNILHADHDHERRLRASEFERARLNTNLEYARSLLTRVEQEALQVKQLSRRQEMQADLNRKRELLERLVDRMHDLEQLLTQCRQLHEDDDQNSSDGEDILAEIIPTPSESMDSRSTDIPTENTGDQDDEEDEMPDLPPPVSSATSQSTPAAPAATETQAPSTQSPDAGTTTTQTLRARGPVRPPSPTSTSTATARAALFANRRNTLKSSAAGATGSTATAEAILDHQRAEQDALSESILKMAGALKASSQRFSSTLEQDKNVLSRAGEGMEKTERGMEAAYSRMGTLRKMTEGKGWWGRIILYAWVYGLMLALVLLVFVMPKLRF